ncbi:M3 family oligoendopeptidase [Acholeplasma equirhinis]|uniref:M3 family oligoendopeptidase n=1 Tax=Acholeplasma equirhinis TaxID=555393 RepID=UPI00197AD4E7|nr:M3 family oligoendopeptidase [Acholeplasma equirhinis]MBN3490924.1 M3 family oligoendopeptidase [Acholeplasma equirhinis]
MKFQDYPYVRPDMDEFKKQTLDLLAQFNNAKSSAEQLEVIKAYNKMFDHIDSTLQLVYVRHSLNTTDEFYAAERDFLDQVEPEIQGLAVEFSKAVLYSKFKPELEKALGSLIFKQYELAEKTFKEEIIPLLQEENKLITQYGKLASSAKIEFDGKVRNLPQMRAYNSNIDRAVRKRAALAVSNWYSEHEAEYDEIYDNMVKVRHQIAKTLGYPSYIEYMYDSYRRVDYNRNDVKVFRDEILKEVVPFAKDVLMKHRSETLGIKDLKSHDLGLTFLSGNATPKGDRAWQVDKAMKMYDAMSPETSEFFRFMVERDLLDLDAKQGKEGGGYCTYIPDYESPFIFANFNGTSADVDVLTHEAGHAFQIYTSRNNLPELRWPTMEAAEIHSMSMEFLAWRWIHEFFEEDTAKYKYAHLADGVEILPYIALVDHFQHEVFENIDMTPQDRKALWRKLEKQYLPWKDYSEDQFLDKGTYWFRQGHIFQNPFYYIDYALAQTIAFQFWVLSQNDFDKAWEKYLALCKLGGSKSFVDLVLSAKLDNPFKEGFMKKTMEPIKNYLKNVDKSIK